MILDQVVHAGQQFVSMRAVCSDKFKIQGSRLIVADMSYDIIFDRAYLCLEYLTDTGVAELILSRVPFLVFFELSAVSLASMIFDSWAL